MYQESININETQGCISISIGIKSKGSIETTPFALNSYYEVAFLNPQVEVGISDTNSNIQADVIKSNTQIDTKSKNDTQITCGLVCGADIGANVLYASDGALITIDGEYLIVQKE